MSTPSNFKARQAESKPLFQPHQLFYDATEKAVLPSCQDGTVYVEANDNDAARDGDVILCINDLATGAAIVSLLCWTDHPHLLNPHGGD